jgi:hypothetical protein
MRHITLRTVFRYTLAILEFIEGSADHKSNIARDHPL